MAGKEKNKKLYHHYLISPLSFQLIFIVRSISLNFTNLAYLDIILLLLLQAGDIEVNPGPTKFPCGICTKACTWKTKAVACDTCNIWYHTRCMTMTDETYASLKNISWECLKCGLPNFSSSFYDSSSDSDSTETKTNNKFQILNPDEKSRQTATRSTVTSIETKERNRPAKCMPPINRQNLVVNVFNFQSLKNKIPEFSAMLENNRPDIVIGTETWLNSDIKNTELPFSGEYEIHRRDRGKDKGGGGIVIMVKNNMKSKIIKSGENNESLFCEVGTERNKQIFGAIYRPQDTSEEAHQQLIEDIKSITKTANCNVFIGGDFNLPDINWKNMVIDGNQNSKELNELFIDAIFELGLSQTNLEPTRKYAILDIFLTNNESITQTTTIPGLGDHQAGIEIYIQTHVNRSKPTKRTIHLWKKADPIKLKEECKNFADLFVNRQNINEDVEKLWNCIKENLTRIIQDNIETKVTSKSFTKPWITTKIKRLIRRKKRWYKKMKSCSSERVMKKYQYIKTLTQKECRKEHNDFINNIVSNPENNGKRLFSYIKSKSKDSGNTIQELQDKTGKAYQNPKDKAEILNDQFSSVFSNPINHTIGKSKGKKHNKMKDIRISRNGVHKLLINLNPNKATGPDNIPGRLLKLCADELATVYTLLFQASLDQGKIPDDWKTANIMPLYKKGTKSNPENYRPVSLTSISCKMLEHIIHSSIMDHLDSKNILNDIQHGFRQGRSCETQLITTCSDFINTIEKNRQVDAILLDFSKAFDKVHHDSLLQKLDFYGIRGNTNNWITSFLKDRTQKVVLEGIESTSRPVLSGVPQGTVLGPLLFLLYINDIGDDLSKGTSLRLFADDSLLYREILNNNDHVTLQKDLDTLQKWEKTWLMEFHPHKCQVLTITKKRKISEKDYFIHNVKLQRTKEAKYLGVTIDSQMNWKAHQRNTCGKSNRTLAFLRRHLSSCPQRTKAKSYEVYVRPVLEYSSNVWDPHHQNGIDLLESVQRRAARWACRDYSRHTSVTSLIENKLKWTTLSERRAKSKVTLLYKAKNKMSRIPSEDLITNNIRSTRRANNGYVVPRSRTDTHLHSFYPSAIRMWNRLPNYIQNSGSIDSFKKGLSTIEVGLYSNGNYNQSHQFVSAKLTKTQKHRSAM